MVALTDRQAKLYASRIYEMLNKHVTYIIVIIIYNVPLLSSLSDCRCDVGMNYCW
jgi:hypothetical protein